MNKKIFVNSYQFKKISLKNFPLYSGVSMSGDKRHVTIMYRWRVYDYIN